MMRIILRSETNRKVTHFMVLSGRLHIKFPESYVLKILLKQQKSNNIRNNSSSFDRIISIMIIKIVELLVFIIFRITNFFIKTLPFSKQTV